jgi:hypothetical protein
MWQKIWIYRRTSLLGFHPNLDQRTRLASTGCHALHTYHLHRVNTLLENADIMPVEPCSFQTATHGGIKQDPEG